MNARIVSLLCAAASAWSGPAIAQRVDRLGPQVRKYLRVDTPEVILEHVEVIDGTGAAPLADRNVRISAGKIAAILPGADELPRDGATILDLRGRSVLPGIVGMHDPSSTLPSRTCDPTAASRGPPSSSRRDSPRRACISRTASPPSGPPERWSPGPAVAARMDAPCCARIGCMLEG